MLQALPSLQGPYFAQTRKAEVMLSFRWLSASSRGDSRLISHLLRLYLLVLLLYTVHR